MSVRATEDGRILLRCFAGCDAKEILAAIGVGWADLLGSSTDSRPSRVVSRPRVRALPVSTPLEWSQGLDSARAILKATSGEVWTRRLLDRYDTSAAAVLAFGGGVLPATRGQLARIVLPMFDASGSIVGVKIRPGRRAKSEDARGSCSGLMGWPTLRAMPEAHVLLAEGEHDGLALAARFPDYAVVAYPGTGRWPRDGSDSLRARDLILVPHADAPGQSVAHAIATALRGVASSVRIADLAPVFQRVGV